MSTSADVEAVAEVARKRKKPLEERKLYCKLICACCHSIMFLTACITGSLFVMIIAGLILLPIILWIRGE
jgi:hypothetical protein